MQTLDLFPPDPSLKNAMAAFERHLIRIALIACDWNQRKAAIALGVLPTTLSEKMQRLDLRSPEGHGPRTKGGKVLRTVKSRSLAGSPPAVEIPAQVTQWCASCRKERARQLPQEDLHA